MAMKERLPVFLFKKVSSLLSSDRRRNFLLQSVATTAHDAGASGFCAISTHQSDLHLCYYGLQVCRVAVNCTPTPLFCSPEQQLKLSEVCHHFFVVFLDRKGGFTMTLVAGSYEKFIWGFKFKNTDTPSLKTLFSYPSHLSTIKCVAVSGPVAVSGGSDDAIKIYDLPSSSEVGSLMDHTGAVTALSFYNVSSLSFPRNLLSGSDDGTVSIYDADPFVHLKTIKAHKKGVNDLGIHPSGKLALTVGKDSCLAMLNLVRGRRSFFCRLDEQATIVKYEGNGERFFLVKEEKVSIHDSEDAKLVLEMENQKRVLCVASAKNGLLFTGGEDRNVTAWDTTTGKVAYCLEGAHSTRVKGIVILTNRADGIEDADEPYLVSSASSDGVIRVWDVRMTRKEKPSPLAETNTKSRLTCLTGSSLKSVRRPKIAAAVAAVPKEQEQE